MEKKTEWDYADILKWKKKEIQLNGWNIFDVQAKDLLEETEPGTDNLNACIEGMLKNMLEGDVFLAGNEYERGSDFAVRYYCDNLSESRRKLFG
jgi:hypothetical protein